MQDQNGGDGWPRGLGSLTVVPERLACADLLHVYMLPSVIPDCATIYCTTVGVLNSLRSAAT
jgi:hypothetical protein